MSSRAVRRLERQKLESAAGHNESDGSGNEDEKPQKAFNAFAFLGGDEEQDEDEDEDEASPEAPEVKPNAASEDKEDHPDLHSHQEAPSVSLPSKKSKSKNKKKSKAKDKPKGKSTAQESDFDDAALDKYLEQVKKEDQKKYSQGSASPGVELSESFDDEMNQFEWSYDNHESTVEGSPDNLFLFFTSKRLQSSLPILSINSIKNLDPDNEFSNLFGKLSKDVIDDANTTTSLSTSPEVLQQIKRLARLTRGWGGRDRRGVPGTTRKLLFTRIRDDWVPTTQKPLHMDELASKSKIEPYLEYKHEELPLEDLDQKICNEKELGVKYFRFVKTASAEERVANTRFYASVIMTPNPESLIQLLQRFPYHAETLLQVAMVLLRQGSDKSTSNGLIEKALFVFDRCLHKNFHELLSEGKNGLIRLPFECFMNRQFYLCIFRYITILGERSTFFTALNYCKLLLSFSPTDDPLGVRYFIDFYAIMSEEYKWLVDFGNSPLVQTYASWLTPGLAFSIPLAYHRLGKLQEAKNSLREAFKRHRYLAFKLLEVIGLSSKLPQDDETQYSVDAILGAETYLVRAALLWKEKDERQFLHDELQALFEEAPEAQTKGNKSFFSKLWSGNDSTEKSKAIPYNLIRFAILSGESRIMGKLPKQVWDRDDVFEYDVIPPVDTSQPYSASAGVQERTEKVVDTLLDYVDQNILGAIVQNESAEDEYAALIERLQLLDQDGAQAVPEDDEE